MEYSFSETFESVKHAFAWQTEYPFVELIVGIGFFFVYLIEEVLLKICKYESTDEATATTNECDGCKDCEAARSMEMGLVFTVYGC